MSIQEERPEFHWADYLVFSASLGICAAIGTYYGCCAGRCQKKTKEQQVLEENEPGKNDIGVLPVSMSVLASFLAAPFVLGTPAEMYFQGTMYSWVVVGFGMASPLVAHILIPVFHRIDVTSGYQYLEKRFNNGVRLMGSAIFSMMMILYMAVVIFAPALAFSQVTGLSMYFTIIGVGVVCTFYTTVGGLKAVIWIDVIQMMIILAGLLVLTIKGTIDAGGFMHVWETSTQGGRIDFLNINPDPRERHTVWSQTFGACFITLVLIGVNQAIVQKYLSVAKCSDAQKTPYISWIFLTLYMLLVCFVGLVMYTYYLNCDPFSAGFVGAKDQLIPYFVMDVLGQWYGIPGLFTAAVFAATLSTVAAGVNALAAITYLDYVVPLYKRFGRRSHPTNKFAAIVTKSLAIFFGILTIALAFMAPLLGRSLLQIAISVFGIAGGPLLGLFILGLFFPFANVWGAVLGTLSSLLFMFWMAIGAIVTQVALNVVPLELIYNAQNCTTNYTEPIMTTMVQGTEEMFTVTTETPGDEGGLPLADFYSISYMWYSLIAVLATLAVGIPVSLCTGGLKLERPDEDLLITWNNLRGKSKSQKEPMQSKEAPDVQMSNGAYDNKAYVTNGDIQTTFQSKPDNTRL